MRLILAFLLWLVSPNVIADSSANGIATNDLIEASSEDEQAFRSDLDFGLEFIAGPCDPENIENTAKLRARKVDCNPPKTSNDENGGKPNDEDGQKPQNGNGKNGNGNGRGLMEYPKEWLWQPPLRVLPPPVPNPEYCPKSKIGEPLFFICHEGPDTEVHGNGDWIENALWCTFFHSHFSRSGKKLREDVIFG
ncbi:hypothetical protein MMC07_003327 [Pseudocyphellaria aurata]|nr:hypothetical protein [Pseudocyphellaria aurata]